MNVPAVHLLPNRGDSNGSTDGRRFGIRCRWSYFPRPSAHRGAARSNGPAIRLFKQGLRVEPHMVRRVLDSRGAPLKMGKDDLPVMNEYVALRWCDDAWRGGFRYSYAAQSLALARGKDRHR